MAISYALLVAPLLALVDQGTALSLTDWVCRGQHGLALHVVHAAFAAAVAPAILLAWRRRRATASAATTSERDAQGHFLAGMAVGVSALSLLAIVAMWVPVWMLSSCLQ
jgi:hypothetical protein